MIKTLNKDYFDKGEVISVIDFKNYPNIYLLLLNNMYYSFSLYEFISTHIVKYVVNCLKKRDDGKYIIDVTTSPFLVYMNLETGCGEKVIKFSRLFKDEYIIEYDIKENMYGN